MKIFLWLILIFGSMVNATSLRATGFTHWTFSLNVPSKKFENKVAALRINITDGTIESLSRFPSDWSITIDNESNGSARLIGGFRHGGSGLPITYFKDFLRIESLDGRKPRVEVSLFSMTYVAKNFDFEQKEFRLRRVDISIKKIINISDTKKTGNE